MTKKEKAFIEKRWLEPTNKQLEATKQHAKLRTIEGIESHGDWGLIAVDIPRLVATIRKLRDQCVFCGKKAGHFKFCSRKETPCPSPKS